jgi:hypothetical protein
MPRKKKTLLAIDQIFGVPAHPLFVHVPVVLVPLAAILAVSAIYKRFRQPLLIAAATMAAIGGIGVLLAASSGESLSESAERTSTTQYSEADGGEEEGAEEHEEKGDAAQAPAVIFAGITMIAATEEVLRRSKYTNKLAKLPKWAPAVLLTATIASGAVATAFVYDAGHSGAKAVWTGIDGRVTK